MLRAVARESLHSSPKLAITVFAFVGGTYTYVSFEFEIEDLKLPQCPRSIQTLECMFLACYKLTIPLLLTSIALLGKRT